MVLGETLGCAARPRRRVHCGVGRQSLLVARRCGRGPGPRTGRAARRGRGGRARPPRGAAAGRSQLANLQHPPSPSPHPPFHPPPADNTTSRLYLHRPGSWPPTLLLETQPELSGHRLANMHPLVIPARDSLRLPAYLTLPLASGVPAALPRGVSAPPPPGALADGTVDAAAAVLPGARPPGSPAVAAAAAGAAKRAAQGAGGGGGVHFMTKAELARWRPPAPALSKEQASPGGAALSQSQAAAAAAAAAATAGAPRPLNLSLPMVLLVHGGPWLRDGWGADGVGQWLANRGYAVLQVRGGRVWCASEGQGEAQARAAPGRQPCRQAKAPPWNPPPERHGCHPGILSPLRAARAP